MPVYLSFTRLGFRSILSSAVAETAATADACSAARISSKVIAAAIAEASAPRDRMMAKANRRANLSERL
jgi:hypothetical protein